PFVKGWSGVDRYSDWANSRPILGFDFMRPCNCSQCCDLKRADDPFLIGQPSSGVYWTVFSRAPMPDISTLILSPIFIGPTPEGVPVMMTSPGSSVMIELTNSMMKNVGKIMSDVVESCLTMPF